MIGRKVIKKDVNTFIEEHEHINYCEALIDRNGLIGYVNPSHLYSMIAEYGKTQEEVDREMPITASPIHWMVEKTGYVAVWFDYMLTPNELTREQIECIKKLRKSRIVNF